ASCTRLRALRAKQESLHLQSSALRLQSPEPCAQRKELQPQGPELGTPSSPAPSAKQKAPKAAKPRTSITRLRSLEGEAQSHALMCTTAHFYACCLPLSSRD